MAEEWSGYSAISRSFIGTSIVKGDTSNSQLDTDTPYYSAPYARYEASDGLWVFDQHGNDGYPRILVTFDLSTVPTSIIPLSSKIRLTIGQVNLLNDMTLYCYKVPTTKLLYMPGVSQTITALQYDGTNNWDTYLMGSTDYDSVALDTYTVPSTASAGLEVEFNVTDTVVEALGSVQRLVQFLIVPADSRRTSAVSNIEYIRFYTGNPTITSYTDTWGTYYQYPYDGNGTTDKPTIIIEETGAVTFYLADSGGNFSTSNTMVGPGVDYYNAGFYVPGGGGDPWKMFVKNNITGYLYDVRIWCDWARANVPAFSGTGSATMSYISVINGDPGNGSPNTQLWQMTCISGGTEAVWSVQYDQNTYYLYGSSTWYDASPSTLTGVGSTGYYTSTANTQGISFTLSGVDADVGDKFTWSTFQNTSVQGAVYDSESYLKIASDISGSPGLWEYLQPPHSLISLPISAGSTIIPVTSVTNYLVDDRIVVTDVSTGSKYYNSISEINITGSTVTVTGGVQVALVGGDSIQKEPFNIGDLAPNGNGIYYKPFWLMVDIPDISISEGLRALRINVTEGP